MTGSETLPTETVKVGWDSASAEPTVDRDPIRTNQACKIEWVPADEVQGTLQVTDIVFDGSTPPPEGEFSDDETFDGDSYRCTDNYNNLGKWKYTIHATYDGQSGARDPEAENDQY